MLLKGVSFFVGAQPDSVCRGWSIINIKYKGLLRGLGTYSGAMCLFRLVVCGEAWLVYGWRKLISEAANERQRQTDGQRCG